MTDAGEPVGRGVKLAEETPEGKLVLESPLRLEAGLPSLKVELDSGELAQEVELDVESDNGLEVAVG